MEGGMRGGWEAKGEDGGWVGVMRGARGWREGSC